MMDWTWPGSPAASTARPVSKSLARPSPETALSACLHDPGGKGLWSIPSISGRELGLTLLLAVLLCVSRELWLRMGGADDARLQALH